MDSAEFSDWQTLLSIEPLHLEHRLNHAETLTMLHNCNSQHPAKVSDFLRDYWREEKPKNPDDIFEFLKAKLVKSK